MKTITSANSVYLLSVTSIFPVPIRLQGFAADAAFATDSITVAETAMGVDGKLSGGYTPASTSQTVSLQADSTSVEIFETWQTFQQVNREVFTASAIITIPSLQRQYTMTRGFLKTLQQLSDAKKVLQPRAFVIEWERVDMTPIV